MIIATRATPGECPRRYASCGFILGLVLAAGLPTASASAQNLTGTDLLDSCAVAATDSNYDYARGLCVGYILGVADKLRSDAARICIDNSVTPRQIRDSVVRYLQANRSERERAADALISAALTEAYPCK